MRQHTQWRWHFEEVYVRINGEMRYLWRAVTDSLERSRCGMHLKTGDHLKGRLNGRWVMTPMSGWPRMPGRTRQHRVSRRRARVLRPTLQLAQHTLVSEPLAAIHLHKGLIGSQSRRAVGTLHVHLAPVEVGVAGVQDPACAGVDRHPRMAPGVPGQLDHQDFGRKSLERPHGLEAEPGLPACGVGPPVANRVELRRAIAAPRDEAPPPSLRRLALARQHVDRGLREVLDTVGVVEVEMGEDDVAHVAGGEAPRLQLEQGCVLDAKPDVEQGVVQPAGARMRMLHVPGRRSRCPRAPSRPASRSAAPRRRPAPGAPG